jgi:hypothetical protein
MNDTPPDFARAPTLDYASPSGKRPTDPWDVLRYSAWTALIVVLGILVLLGAVLLIASLPRSWFDG